MQFIRDFSVTPNFVCNFLIQFKDHRDNVWKMSSKSYHGQIISLFVDQQELEIMKQILISLMIFILSEAIEFKGLLFEEDNMTERYCIKCFLRTGYFYNKITCLAWFSKLRTRDGCETILFSNQFLFIT